MLYLARTIVASHRCDESETQRGEPYPAEMYECDQQNNGQRVAEICRKIYYACGLSHKADWVLLLNNASWVMSPYQGILSEAQANMNIGYPGVYLEE